MSLRPLYAAFILLGIAAAGGRAAADVIFGSNARSTAMGGAGLAIVDRSGYNTLVNPAGLALYNRRVKLAFPNVGIHVSGVSLSAAASHLFGNPDKNDAVSLAKDFGSHQTDFGVSLGESLRLGHMDAALTGIASV